MNLVHMLSAWVGGLGGLAVSILITDSIGIQWVLVLCFQIILECSSIQQKTQLHQPSMIELWSPNGSFGGISQKLGVNAATKDWRMLHLKMMFFFEKESEFSFSRILILEGFHVKQLSYIYIYTYIYIYISNTKSPQITICLHQVLSLQNPNHKPYLSDSATGVRQRPGKAIAE